MSVRRDVKRVDEAVFSVVVEMGRFRDRACFASQATIGERAAERLSKNSPLAATTVRRSLARLCASGRLGRLMKASASRFALAYGQSRKESEGYLQIRNALLRRYAGEPVLIELRTVVRQQPVLADDDDGGT